MAVNITKTSHFTGGAGTQISFSQIRAEFGGSATNVKASTYLRNTDDNVDWDNENTITSRVPDATENSAVESDNNWSVNSLRDTISNYLVTQSGTNVELSYNDSDTSTWNSNLSKNIKKTFDVTGNIGADNSNDDALAFEGNLFNLNIEVDENGAVYGEGGNINQNGGDALYVNNTYSKSDVKIRSFGKIWAGGGGGSAGNSGAVGASLACFETSTFNSNNGCGNATLYGKNPNGVRSRCRGGGYRRGQGWNFTNMSGYDCGNGYTYYCSARTDNTVSGGSPGNGGNGGVGRGYSNLNISINASPHIGNSGNSGTTSTCSGNTTNSTGGTGNPGNSGGDFGQTSSGQSGRAVAKKNAKVTFSTENTIKGSITNI